MAYRTIIAPNGERYRGRSTEDMEILKDLWRAARDIHLGGEAA